MAGARFEGKVAVVTGAGAGIGQAVAVAFAREGASVAVVDRDADAAAAAAFAIGASRALAIQADVASADATRAMATSALERFGRIDILVNNAGVRFIAPFVDTSLETWQATIAVNLTGTFLCTQAVVPTMLQQGRGKIVNMASTTGVLALTKRSAYAASKAGVIGLTKALAFDLAPRASGSTPWLRGRPRHH